MFTLRHKITKFPIRVRIHFEPNDFLFDEKFGIVWVVDNRELAEEAKTRNIGFHEMPYLDGINMDNYEVAELKF